ncbi:hypothetical protein JHK85_004578 [Glycine max]|uniref:Uncharacterized protein n=1 Tax=Glycine soja TaxID=3848 RepID=A0A0B2NWY8_GLYSO|nr:hypothetical protein JHK85_004578 [Glycine max]KAG5080337.1 hypothetical protein JHK86_004402 [Glycine max]KHN00012.1 hypothetical protein glysoja_034223 [Glycine soja]
MISLKKSLTLFPPPPTFPTTLLHPHLNTPIKQHPLREKPTFPTVFGIAALSRLWNHRKEYIKLWWRTNVIRGNVWLDQEVTNEPSQEYLLPTLRISSDVSKFKVKNLHRKRLGVRISRIVSEKVRLGMDTQPTY